MRNTTYKRLLTVVLCLAFLPGIQAKEGMWIPSLINNVIEGEMKTMGMKLNAEDVYAFNKSSLKDAVVHFGGGCTSELISDKGLLLTNHHCGYGRIQSHSSVEKNYLRDGFWAMSMKDELPNPGLTATIILRIEDVTSKILNGTTAQMSQNEKAVVVRRNMKEVGAQAVKGSAYGYIIRPFYYGNQFYMFITEVFKDVRLVGAPPSSIGKFGFDTDNWVWPRHTGDFSIFRIYANKDNKPADYSEDNKPYTPKHHFPVNLKGANENDFTMVYGFPGRTQEYLSSHMVDHIINKQDPGRIRMRDKSLEIINAGMRADEKTKIQYAAKQSNISNAWKKWRGEVKGLRRLNAIEKKQAMESKFQKMVDSKEKFSNYSSLLGTFEKTYAEFLKLDYARDMFIELFYYGPEIIRFSDRFNKLYKMLEVDTFSNEAIEKETEALKRSVEGHFKNYNASMDQDLLASLSAIYFDELSEEQLPSIKATVEEKYKGDLKAYSDFIFEKSMFDDKETLLAFLEKPKAKKIAKDPAFSMRTILVNQYFQAIKPSHSVLKARIDSMYSVYMKALMEVLPDEQTYFPDANSTLRLSFGKVEGYEAADGVTYSYYTTLDGIMDKYIPGDYEFDVPEKLVKLYETKDYGKYAKDGQLRVCFIASNHTTGGNSGSPVLDANGYLIGLNFDRVWEGTMSDIMFDPEKCRNIMVDLNYVLFIVDKFAGAGHLVEEMSIIE